MTPAEQIAQTAVESAKDQLRFLKSPDARLSFVLKSVAWPDIQADVIAACRRRLEL